MKERKKTGDCGVKVMKESLAGIGRYILEVNKSYQYQYKQYEAINV